LLFCKRVYHWLNTSSFALAGSIPTEFGKLTNLTHLSLHANNLTGRPPFAHFLCFVYESTNFNQVSFMLTAATFSGRIPTELGLLTNLTGDWRRHGLGLASNQLTGV
jgi:hypothetical protein